MKQGSQPHTTAQLAVNLLANLVQHTCAALPRHIFSLPLMTTAPIANQTGFETYSVGIPANSTNATHNTTFSSEQTNNFQLGQPLCAQQICPTPENNTRVAGLQVHRE